MKNNIKQSGGVWELHITRVLLLELLAWLSMWQFLHMFDYIIYPDVHLSNMFITISRYWRYCIYIPPIREVWHKNTPITGKQNHYHASFHTLMYVELQCALALPFQHPNFKGFVLQVLVFLRNKTTTNLSHTMVCLIP